MDFILISVLFATSSNFLSFIEFLKKSFFSNSLLSSLLSTPPCNFKLILDASDNELKYFFSLARYLSRERKYFNLLSDASKISLKLQGGVLNKKESEECEKKDFFKSSIKLRKFDEIAKRTDIKMKSIIEYKDLLSSQLL